MSSPGKSQPACWFCGLGTSPYRAEAESVIAARSGADGGPFRTLTCHGCRTTCGVLRNRRGEWMLYPLEGRAEPTLIDRLVPRTNLEHLERARQWWLLYAADVERFRAARPERARPAGARREPPVRPRASGARADRKPAAASPPAPSTPRAVLGVATNASLRDVQRAWRAAVKRWHPDRIPTTDPVVLAEAHRRFSELRAAYEALTAELSG